MFSLFGNQNKVKIYVDFENVKLKGLEELTGNDTFVKTDNEKTKYFIVSKDKGYQAVIDYWKDYEIKRVLNLKQVKNEDLEVI